MKEQSCVDETWNLQRSNSQFIANINLVQRMLILWNFDDGCDRG